MRIRTRCVSSLWLLLVASYCNLATAETSLSLTDKISMATEALAQGDSSLAGQLIQTETAEPNYALLQLEILYWLEQRESDQAIDKLRAFEQLYPLRADTFAFSSEVWRSIGHQVNIFAKSGYYKKAVAAKIKAGQLAPDNPRYMTLAASALGQADNYGGDMAAQKPLTERIVGLDKKWGYIARINLAQNNDEYTQGRVLAAQAVAEFGQDFDILERVGQFHWTLGEYNEAQYHFLQACKNRPNDEWHLQIKWQNACYLVGEFAKEQEIGLENAVEALTILLSVYTLPTESNFASADLLLTLASAEQASPAIDMLSRILNESADKKLRRKAEKVLQRLKKQTQAS